MLCEEKLEELDRLAEKVEEAREKCLSFEDPVSRKALEYVRRERIAKKYKLDMTDYDEMKEHPQNWRIIQKQQEARYALQKDLHVVRCFIPLDLYNNGNPTKADFEKYMFYDTFTWEN